MLDFNAVSTNEFGSFLGLLTGVGDSRARRGVRHNVPSVLAVAACAVMAGMRSYIGIGEWVADLSQQALKKLGCRYHPERKTFVAPSEATIRRMLQNSDADELDSLMGQWLSSKVESEAIAIDGKTLKGSRDGQQKAVHLISALVHQSGVIVGQKHVDGKTNEIPELRKMVAEFDLRGKVVTADAMHTQRDTAEQLLKQGADYVFTVKGNQPDLFESIGLLDRGSFSPSVDYSREGTRQDRHPNHPGKHGSEHIYDIPRGRAGVHGGTTQARPSRRPEKPRDSLWGDESDS